MPVDSILASPTSQSHLRQLGKNLYAKAKPSYVDFPPDTSTAHNNSFFAKQYPDTPLSMSPSSSPTPIPRWSVPRIRLEPPACDKSVGEKAGDLGDSTSSADLDLRLTDVLNKIQSVTSTESSLSDPVTLPCRYARRMSDSQDKMTPTDQEISTTDDDMSMREKDLGIALKWIRQEILQMKEQDKSLLKQFIELRASILQLRCVYDMHGSCSDVSSLDGSTYSLNEQAKSPKLRRLVLEGDFHNKASLSLPNSPRVARFRWRSDEII